MIKSFRTRETELLYSRQKVGTFPPSLQKRALRKPVMIDATVSLNDLKVPPGNRLERLKGGRSDQYSIRINDQWRICFRFVHGDAYDVEIIDYHK